MDSGPLRERTTVSASVRKYASAVVLGITLFLILSFLARFVPRQGQLIQIYRKSGAQFPDQVRAILSVHPVMLTVAGSALIVLLVAKEYLIRSRSWKFSINLIAFGGTVVIIAQWLGAIHIAQSYIMNR